MHIILTCEHATNFIPKEFKKYFIKNTKLLNSHQAFDLNAKLCAEYLYKILHNKHQCSMHLAKISRLLIDHNRSLSNPRCWSSISSKLSLPEKKLLIEQYYTIYRGSILNDLANNIKHSKILHLSMHSFTNKLNNQIRTNDLGILYDSTRKQEAKLAITLQKKLQINHSVRRNYPYLGKSDGLTSAIRKLYPENKYLGFEIELNQNYQNWQKIMNSFIDALEEIL